MNDQSTAVKHGIYREVEHNGLTKIENAVLYANDTEYDADDVANLVTGVGQQDKRINELMERNRTLGNEMHHFKQSVRNVFSEMVDDRDIDKERANELLDVLDIDRLPAKYRATLTFEVTVTCESGEDIDGVEAALRDSEVDLSNYSTYLDDLDVDTQEVTDVSVEEDE